MIRRGTMLRHYAGAKQGRHTAIYYEVKNKE